MFAQLGFDFSMAVLRYKNEDLKLAFWDIAGIYIHTHRLLDTYDTFYFILSDFSFKLLNSICITHQVYIFNFYSYI